MQKNLKLDRYLVYFSLSELIPALVDALIHKHWQRGRDFIRVKRFINCVEG